MRSDRRIVPRASVRAAHGYAPGRQFRTGVIAKLNTNESAHPPSPAVARALREIDAAELRYYPGESVALLGEAIATLCGVPSGRVLVTNGAQEMLRLVVGAFAEPTIAPIAIVEPGYTFYRHTAELAGCAVASIGLEADWSISAATLRAVGALAPQVSILTNPHSPSGRLMRFAEIVEAGRLFGGVLVLDETYADFVAPEDRLDIHALWRELPNAVIVRSLSKGYALAGVRVGYGLARPELLEAMRKVKDGFSVDVVAATLARAAIEDRAYYERLWCAVRASRDALSAALERRGFDVARSDANFVLARPPARLPPASRLAEALEHHGLLVRCFTDARMRAFLRITVGRDEENRALLAAIDHLCGADVMKEVSSMPPSEHGTPTRIKSGHELHRSRDAADFVQRLDAAGIALDDLVRPCLSAGADPAIILCGSIANGTATHESDVDILVLHDAPEERVHGTDGVRFHTGAHSEVLVYREGIEFNIYFAEAGALDGLVGCFSGVRPSRYGLDGVVSVPQLEESDLLFLDRLRSGWVLRNEPKVLAWRTRFATDLLPTYLAVRHNFYATELFEDAWSYLGGPPGAARRVGAQCVEHALIATLAAQGLTNQSHKLLIHWCHQTWPDDVSAILHDGLALLAAPPDSGENAERAFLTQVRAFVDRVRDRLVESADTRFGVRFLEAEVAYSSAVRHAC